MARCSFCLGTLVTVVWIEAYDQASDGIPVMLDVLSDVIKSPETQVAELDVDALNAEDRLLLCEKICRHCNPPTFYPGAIEHRLRF